jgi:outer membrane protein
LKKILISMLAFSILAFGGTAFAAPKSSTTNQSVQSCNIGFIDTNRIMAESPSVKVFQDQLNQIGKEMSSQLEAEKANLTPEEFSKRREEIHGEFMKVKNEKEGEIDAIIKKSMEKVAKEKNLVVILYKNSVAFAGIDVTLDVMNNM